MPKRVMNGTAEVMIEEVVELHELGNLAEEWARSIAAASFPAEKFDRYQHLARKYAVDAATLLYTYQARRDGHVDDVPSMQHTGVIPDLPLEV